jgi:hypothetical protein
MLYIIVGRLVTYIIESECFNRMDGRCHNDDNQDQRRRMQT